MAITSFTKLTIKKENNFFFSPCRHPVFSTKKGTCWLISAETWLAERLIRLVNRDIIQHLYSIYVITCRDILSSEITLLCSTQHCHACQTDPQIPYGCNDAWMGKTSKSGTQMFEPLFMRHSNPLILFFFQ